MHLFILHALEPPRTESGSIDEHRPLPDLDAWEAVDVVQAIKGRTDEEDVLGPEDGCEM